MDPMYIIVFLLAVITLSVFLQSYHVFEFYADECDTYSALQKQEAKKCQDNEKLLWVGKPTEPKKPFCDEHCPEGYTFDAFGNVCKNNETGDKRTPKRTELTDICPEGMTYFQGKCYEPCKANYNLKQMQQTFCVNPSNSEEDYAATSAGNKQSCSSGQSSVTDNNGNWYCHKTCPRNYVASFDETTKKVNCKGKKNRKDDTVVVDATKFDICPAGQTFYENSCWTTCKPNFELQQKSIPSCSTCA